MCFVEGLATHGLQRTERAALACEIAAQGMEEACEELEKASEVCWPATFPRHYQPTCIEEIHEESAADDRVTRKKGAPLRICTSSIACMLCR